MKILNQFAENNKDYYSPSKTWTGCAIELHCSKYNLELQSLSDKEHMSVCIDELKNALNKSDIQLDKQKLVKLVDKKESFKIFYEIEKGIYFHIYSTDQEWHNKKWIDLYYKVWWLRKGIFHLIGIAFVTYLLVLCLTSPFGFITHALDINQKTVWDLVFPHLFTLGVAIWVLIRFLNSYVRGNFFLYRKSL